MNNSHQDSWESAAMDSFSMVYPDKDFSEQIKNHTRQQILLQARTRRRQRVIRDCAAFAAVLALVILTIWEFRSGPNENIVALPIISPQPKAIKLPKLIFSPQNQDNSVKKLESNMDYGKLDNLLSNANVIVYGKVSSIQDRIEFTTWEILKGQPDDLSIHLPGDRKPTIGCMSPLKWRLNEECCLFLNKNKKSGRLSLIYMGDGKQRMPYRGFLGVEILKDLIDTKRVDSQALADILEKKGPGALMTLSDNLNKKKYDLEFDGEEIQNGLIEYINKKPIKRRYLSFVLKTLQKHRTVSIHQDTWIRLKQQFNSYINKHPSIRDEMSYVNFLKLHSDEYAIEALKLSIDLHMKNCQSTVDKFHHPIYPMRTSRIWEKSRPVLVCLRNYHTLSPGIAESQLVELHRILLPIFTKDNLKDKKPPATRRIEYYKRLKTKETKIEAHVSVSSEDIFQAMKDFVENR